MGIEETTLGAAIVLLYGIVLVLNGRIKLLERRMEMLWKHTMTSATWSIPTDPTQTELMQ